MLWLSVRSYTNSYHNTDTIDKWITDTILENKKEGEAVEIQFSMAMENQNGESYGAMVLIGIPWTLPAKPKLEVISLEDLRMALVDRGWRTGFQGDTVSATKSVGPYGVTRLHITAREDGYVSYSGDLAETDLNLLRRFGQWEEQQ